NPGGSRVLHRRRARVSSLGPARPRTVHRVAVARVGGLLTKRRIAVVTTSRADYGIFRPLLSRLRDDPRAELKIVATGMHLLPEYGSTYRQIEADGFAIDVKLPMLLASDDGASLTKSVGVGLIGL